MILHFDNMTRLLLLCCAVVAGASAEVIAVDDLLAIRAAELVDPEIGWYGFNATRDLNATSLELEAEDDASEGRQLAEAAAKPKRKYCNTSAYGLKGDYAYEACGAFCKQAKAVNHCKFCKCRACSFCATTASFARNVLGAKGKGKSAAGAAPPLSVSSGSKEVKKAARLAKIASGKKKGKGLGKKKRMKME